MAGDTPTREPGPVSDRWLRTFVAVVEAGSFTAAARRAEISQPAVSHSVARLEKVLGRRLFDRGGRSLTLTPAGRRLHDQLAPGFAQVDAAVASIVDVAPGPVSLSVSTSLANFWLLPRLPEFKRLHPDVDLRVITTDSDATVGADDADLWIPLGSVDRLDLASATFRSERLIPVASPALAATLAGTDPGELLAAPLLHLEERYVSRFDWHRWFAANGVATPDALPGDHTNDYSLVLQAALEGQGVALGWEHIVSGLIDSGRLVALAEPVETDNPFTVLWRRTPALSADASALRDWLVS